MMKIGASGKMNLMLLTIWNIDFRLLITCKREELIQKLVWDFTKLFVEPQGYLLCGIYSMIFNYYLMLHCPT